ncbi:hypothetical protein WJX79_009490 [Trebouxia sp. C0005]
MRAVLQAVAAGRRSGQARHTSTKSQYQPEPGFDLGYPAEIGYQAPRHPEEPHKEAHHGRRSGVSPTRRRVTAAAAETLYTLPTVKEMHLQRVATMAAAAATAQQISADVESHEQFAKELRSYRSQGVGGGQRRVTKPSWESDLGTGGSFGAEYPSSGPESGYDGAPGELQWQTRGAPHHLHMAPAAKQLLPGGVRKKEALVRRRKDPFVGSPSFEQATPADADAWLDAQTSALRSPQGSSTPPPPDPPDMPGINRAGLLSLRNKLRSRPALMSPSTNAFTSSTISAPLSPQPGIGAQPGQRRASGQGLKGAATRAALRSKPSTDNQVAAALPRTSLPPARPSGDAYSIPNSGPGMAAGLGDLTQCEGCGRSFNPKAFEVHSRICAKVFQTKRKAFNVAEARVADTGAEHFYDARRGAPKAEAGGIGSSKPGRKPAR